MLYVFEFVLQIQMPMYFKFVIGYVIVDIVHVQVTTNSNIPYNIILLQVQSCFSIFYLNPNFQLYLLLLDTTQTPASTPAAGGGFCFGDSKPLNFGASNTNGSSVPAFSFGQQPASNAAPVPGN